MELYQAAACAGEAGGRPRTVNHYLAMAAREAMGGDAGPKPGDALEKTGRWTVETVERSETARGFEVIPRHRVAERAFAWFGRCRGLARDRE